MENINQTSTPASVDKIPAMRPEDTLKTPDVIPVLRPEDTFKKAPDLVESIDTAADGSSEERDAAIKQLADLDLELRGSDTLGKRTIDDLKRERRDLGLRQTPYKKDLQQAATERENILNPDLPEPSVENTKAESSTSETTSTTSSPEGGSPPPQPERTFTEEEKELRKKIEDGSATLDDIEEYGHLLKYGKEKTQSEKNKEEFSEVAQRIKDGTATEEDKLRYIELKEEINREKLEELDMAWKERAANGDSPALELIAFQDEFNRLNGEELMTDEQRQDFKRFFDEIYKDGIEVNNPENSRIREKFIELGKIEAMIHAQAKIIEGMKKSEKKMKKEVHQAEEAYLNSSNEQDRMQKLTVFRQKALQLEGYQIAINEQASKGREYNIRRRQAAGYIHRKLGTRGLGGNLTFGLHTLAYQMSDVFQNVTIDQTNRFA